jgi:hypothetical protein
MAEEGDEGLTSEASDAEALAIASVGACSVPGDIDSAVA